MRRAGDVGLVPVTEHKHLSDEFHLVIVCIPNASRQCVGNGLGSCVDRSTGGLWIRASFKSCVKCECKAKVLVSVKDVMSLAQSKSVGRACADVEIHSDHPSANIESEDSHPNQRGELDWAVLTCSESCSSEALRWPMRCTWRPTTWRRTSSCCASRAHRSEQ